MCVRTVYYLYRNPYGNLFHPHLHPHDHTILLRWYSCRMHDAQLLIEQETYILHKIATHVYVC